MTPLIQVQQVSKEYRSYNSMLKRVLAWFGINKQPCSKSVVLNNISFNMNAGEAVALVGENGAGKSTLLKIITGTIRPSSGQVTVHGKVSAILELGLGFNPEMTGRQNVYLAGAVMGYRTEELTELIPFIQKFSELGEYFDQPVRTYSSGMQMRLAFSVATAKRPELLIVDEALSVGDAAFQRKCFQRIESFRENGTSLLFVSHDIETVKKLCNKALFIKHGEIAAWGNAKEVCDQYERFLFGGETNRQSAMSPKTVKPVIHPAKFDPELTASCEMVYGNGKAIIESSWLSDLDGNRVNIIESGCAFKFCYQVHFNEAVAEPIFAMMLKTREGVAIYGVDSTQLLDSKISFQANDRVDIAFTLENPIAPGTYYLNCGVKAKGQQGDDFLTRRVDTAIVRIISGDTTTVMTGLAEMRARLEIA